MPLAKSVLMQYRQVYSTSLSLLLIFLVYGIIRCNFRREEAVPKKTLKKESKVESEQLRDYELTLIISPEVVEEKFDTTVDNVSQFITGRGGVISDIERWGKRRLAYPIKHFVEGSYVLFRFKLKSALGKELEANLQISEDVLRHLLIKLGD